MDLSLTSELLQLLFPLLKTPFHPLPCFANSNFLFGHIVRHVES